MRVELTPSAQDDLAELFDYLHEIHMGFGYSAGEAAAKARDRVVTVQETALSIAKAPYRGTLHEDMLPGLRHLTIDRAIYWFITDDAAQAVLILAIFSGGQDHIHHMMQRLLARQ